MTLTGTGRTAGVAEPVERAVAAPRLAVEESTQERNRLREAADAPCRRIEGHADLLVLRLRVTGPEPELETAIAEHVERPRRPGDEHRMVEVVVLHVRPESDRLRRVRRGMQHHERRGCADVSRD